jgi:hypothetical protein
MEPALFRARVKRTMKLHVHTGPLPIAPPYFDWEDTDLDSRDERPNDEEEIDLTDLFETPKAPKVENLH